MLKVSRRLAEALSSESMTECEPLEQLISSYGATLFRPAAVADDAGQFVIVGGVELDSDGERLRCALESLDGVEGAYFKPADELP
jgi:hypothetical protein